MSGLKTFPVECKYQTFSCSALSFPPPVPVTAVVSARGDIRVQGGGGGAELGVRSYGPACQLVGLQLMCPFSRRLLSQ
jgi:hypothetical protein